MTKVNERFKRFLQHKGLSQTDFSQITGYGEKSLSNFLTGRVKYPKIDLIDAVIRNFSELNLTWLFTGEGEMFTNEKLISSNELKQELDNLRIENSKLKDKIIELLEKA
ncbi:MAG: helix-turn-helix domain-containing protein [Saprospiraceae bacterium]